MRTSEMKTQSPSGSRGRALVRISNLPPWLSLLCMVIYIKEEPTMQISVSSTLTVYHDGQFWVGLAEHVEDGRYGAARIVFGAEPSNEETCDSLQTNGRSSRSSATIQPRRASPRRTQATRSRGGEGTQAAGDGNQGAADTRGTAGSDEAEVGSSKKPTPRRR